MKTYIFILFSILSFSTFAQVSEQRLELNEENEVWLTREEFYQWRVNGKLPIMDILQLQEEFIDEEYIDYWAKGLAPLGVPRGIKTSTSIAPRDTIVITHDINYFYNGVELVYTANASYNSWRGLSSIKFDRQGKLTCEGFATIVVGGLVNEIFEGKATADRNIAVKISNDTGVFLRIEHQGGVIKSMWFRYFVP